MTAEADARTSLGLASVSVATAACVCHASGARWERTVLVSTVSGRNQQPRGTDDDAVAVDARDHDGRDGREPLTGARVRGCGHGRVHT